MASRQIAAALKAKLLALDTLKKSLMYDLLTGNVRVGPALSEKEDRRMSEAGYVELPILQWLSGLGSAEPGDKGLGWTYRDEEAMAAFDRPLEDPLVEKLLVAAILRINDHVKIPDAGEAGSEGAAQDDGRIRTN